MGNPLSVHAYQHLEKEQKQTLWGPVVQQVCFMAPENKQVEAWESSGKERAQGLGHWDTLTHTLTFPDGTLLEGEGDCVKEGGILYLKWNDGLQGALWHTWDREQGEVHGDALGAHGEHGLLSLGKEAQDIDRVSPYKLLRLPRSAVQVRRGS